MSNTAYVQFTMNYKGEEYLLEADVSYFPQENKDKLISASDWDMETELYLENVLIFDKQDNNVSECLSITDAELKVKIFRELELMQHEHEPQYNHRLYSRGLSEEDFGKRGFMRDKHFSEDVIIE